MLLVEEEEEESDEGEEESGDDELDGEEDDVERPTVCDVKPGEVSDGGLALSGKSPAESLIWLLVSPE